jgi:hypothetical protein
VCDAESEQELLLRGKDAQLGQRGAHRPPQNGRPVRLRRRAPAGAADATLAATLTEAGYAVGTAYQLADDILDATGTEQDSGKSMGSDEARGKTTAATLRSGRQTEAVAVRRATLPAGRRGPRPLARRPGTGLAAPS